MLENLGELYSAVMPAWELLEFDTLCDSSNVSVPEWNHIAAVIAAHYDDYDGFVVLHGTDTMAYTASALSFMLENLSKPVVLTGSQIPIGAARSAPSVSFTAAATERSTRTSRRRSPASPVTPSSCSTCSARPALRLSAPSSAR